MSCESKNEYILVQRRRYLSMERLYELERMKEEAIQIKSKFNRGSQSESAKDTERYRLTS